MAFKRLLGIGITTIIYGLCAVGWADVKPIDPNTACTVTFSPTFPSKLATLLSQYKTSAPLINGQYVVCFKQDKALPIKTGITFQPVDGDNVVIYGLQLANDPTSTIGFPFLSVSGSNVLLQNLQLTGPGSSIAGSTALALTGSNLSVINSTITGFETGIRAECASPSPLPPPIEGGGIPNCTIGPKNTIEDVRQGVVLPTTSQGVTITQNEIRTLNDPNGTMRKIVLQGAANNNITPPTFSLDPATMTIWKTLSADQLFVTEIGGILPKNGVIELFEHREETKIDGSKTYKDYFLSSCPTGQNDKDQWEFNCTGLGIDAAKGQVFMTVAYSPNTSAMTRWINVQDILDKIIVFISGASTIAPEGGGVVEVPGDSSGFSSTAPSPQPSPTGGEGELIVDDAQPESAGGTNAMMPGAMVLGGDAAPAAAGAKAGCGGMLMDVYPLTLRQTADGQVTLSHKGRGELYAVILWWLVPAAGLWYGRTKKRTIFFD